MSEIHTAQGTVPSLWNRGIVLWPKGERHFHEKPEENLRDPTEHTPATLSNAYSSKVCFY